MSSKDDFYKKLEENDIFLSLTHYQRLTIAEIHEKQLTIPYVSSSFSIEFAQYIAENHYKLVNVENGKYYWKNETHLKTSQQLMKTFKDTIGFK